ncbi:hypothetical protein BCV70DRAFT_196946 [Testicularia cyperi]|uniref:Secreted protein n=1 Tax=Testicularia cyperi TaxID=1882483 RepID=A0A317XXQ5_9BASI|nr:hypothetical protein BCV70DRAFT_196946 [Testicularia cyperi]
MVKFNLPALAPVSTAALALALLLALTEHNNQALAATTPESISVECGSAATSNKNRLCFQTNSINTRSLLDGTDTGFILANDGQHFAVACPAGALQIAHVKTSKWNVLVNTFEGCCHYSVFSAGYPTDGSRPIVSPTKVCDKAAYPGYIALP